MNRYPRWWAVTITPTDMATKIIKVHGFHADVAGIVEKNFPAARVDQIVSAAVAPDLSFLTYGDDA